MGDLDHKGVLSLGSGDAGIACWRLILDHLHKQEITTILYNNLKKKKDIPFAALEMSFYKLEFYWR